MAYTPNTRTEEYFFDDNVPTESRTYIDGNGQTVTKQVKTRLAKGHFPKEELLKDLVHTTFKKSSGTDTQDVATTVEIHNATNIEKVVKPNQLPTLINSTSETIDTGLNQFSGSVFEAKSNNQTNSKGWFYNFTTTFKTWLLTRLLPKGGASGTVLKKVNNTDFNVAWLPDETGTGLPAYTQPTDDNKILRIDPILGATWQTGGYVTTAELVAEADARSDGDDAVTLLVSTETTNRQNADTAIQNELNVTQASVGLNPDGTYIQHAGSNYIDTAISNFDADRKLDDAIGNLATTVAGLNLNNTPVIVTSPTTNGNMVTNTIKFIRIGSIVHVVGFISFNADLILGSTNQVYTNTIPIGFAPASTTYSISLGCTTTFQKALVSITGGGLILDLETLSVSSVDRFPINFTYSTI
jgi:hypothetical protein